MLSVPSALRPENRSLDQMARSASECMHVGSSTIRMRDRKCSCFNCFYGFSRIVFIYNIMYKTLSLSNIILYSQYHIFATFIAHHISHTHLSQLSYFKSAFYRLIKIGNFYIKTSRPWQFLIYE